MDRDKAVLQPEPDGWDKKVPCTFKNLSTATAREIIHRNITHYLRLENFDGLLKSPIDSDEYRFECTREEANAIRDNFHLILTSSYTGVWLTIDTYPLHKLHEQRLSDKRIRSNPWMKILFGFGAMQSTNVFYDHSKQFRYTGKIKVWTERFRATTIILEIDSSKQKLTIPIQSIQKTVLVNRGHNHQPIQIILMLNSAVKIEEKDTNNNSCHRIGHDGVCNSFIDVVSKSSDLLLQFQSPADAWPFLLALPIIGHTNKNQRQDGNLQINFASFSVEDQPNKDPSMQPSLQSFQGRYAFEMLQSLGYIFSNKYIQLSAHIQQSFITIEKQSPKEFYQLSCLVWNALKDNHCASLNTLITSYSSKRNTPLYSAIDMTLADEQHRLVRSITITPLRMIVKPLTAEIGNRALRLRGAERYLRVYIREENDEPLDKLDGTLKRRFKLKMLTNGIRCMGETYYCVGSSSSQIKQLSYWFTSLKHGESVDQVRAQFGDFSKIKNLATYVARIGQYFSASWPTGIPLNYIDTSSVQTILPKFFGGHESFSSLKGWWTRALSWMPTSKTTELQKYSVFVIKDIKENGYCFTDGCGLISLGLAHKVAKIIGIPIKQMSDIPSVFQIRMAGSKGILMIDPESTDGDYYIKLRESMVKFPSDDWTLDVCDYSRPMPLSLNNQIIRLLSDLGNSDAVFESLQNRACKPALWHAPEEAYKNVFENRSVQDQQTRFLNVRDYLLKNKIPLAINEARNLFGVADVTGTLKYGQCFIQYEKNTTTKSRVYEVVKGSVLVTKNPCLYPGDIRKLQAVDVPLLKCCMRNCIVFPTTGPRPHSDEISGSDLDGDQYWVYWGNDLKIIQPIEPLAHSPADKLTVPQITNKMIIDYYLNVVDSNCYSSIADTHTVVADQIEGGTLSTACKELAKLFYRAIDAPKTGELVNIDLVLQLQEQYCKTFPRFMMKFDRSYYESKSVLEKLYLNAKRIKLDQAGQYEYCQQQQSFLTTIRTSSAPVVLPSSYTQLVWSVFSWISALAS